MSAFRIFVSSPIWEFGEYRQALLDAANLARPAGAFEFFFYEEFQIPVDHHKGVGGSIFDVAGSNFDAIFFTFENRVGDGTIYELDYFEEHIPDAAVWWCQVRSAKAIEPNLATFCERLYAKGGLGIPAIQGKLAPQSPEDLTRFFATQLFRTSAELMREANKREKEEVTDDCASLHPTK